MLATYSVVLKRHVGASLGLDVGNLQVLWGLLDPSFCAVCWHPTSLIVPVGAEFGAVCWQPTGLMGACWTEFGAVCWQPTGLLEPVGAEFGAVRWQPTALMEPIEWSKFWLYVGNLQALGPIRTTLGVYAGNLQLMGVWSLLVRLFGAVCWQPTVRLWGACCNQFGAVCLQPTTILLEPIGGILATYSLGL